MYIKPMQWLKKQMETNFQQAKKEIEDEAKGYGTIVQENQKGFNLRKRAVIFLW